MKDFLALGQNLKRSPNEAILDFLDSDFGAGF